VVAEVKDPIKTIKKSAPASLLIVAVLYTLCNVAYFAAGESEPKTETMVLI
jgi:amino acid transporter